MVLYFSGTGNSQFAALRLVELLAEEAAVSINRYLKLGENAVLHSDRPLVFVAPTYAWRLPTIVSDWIAATHFSGSRSAYFILTCGGSVGNAAAHAKKLCEKANLQFRGLAPVVTPNNYVALSSPPGEAECEALWEIAKERISTLACLIQKGEPFPESPVSFQDRVSSGPVCALFYALFVRDKGFAASSACVSCGKCVQRCPLNNIKLAHGKPIWNGRCTHCMACIGGCPTEAIAYKSSSKGNRRYYIMDDALCWEKGGKGT